MSIPEFVFPQDAPNGLAGKARSGGLTKREYAAIQLLAAKFGVTAYCGENQIKDALKCADALLAELAMTEAE